MHLYETMYVDQSVYVQQFNHCILYKVYIVFDPQLLIYRTIAAAKAVIVLCCIVFEVHRNSHCLAAIINLSTSLRFGQFLFCAVNSKFSFAQDIYFW